MINNQDLTQLSFAVGRNFENCQVSELAPLSELTPGEGTSENEVVCRNRMYLLTLGSTVYTTGSWHVCDSDSVIAGPVLPHIFILLLCSKK